MEKIIETIEKNSSIRAEEGDYYVDGLLYCHKCKTPKQAKIKVFGKVRTPFCMCKCEAEKRDREEEARQKEEQERRIRDLKRMGFPDAEMQNWTFEKDDCKNSKISKVAHNYVENFREMYKQNKGLLFYGSVGTGKTFISSCIANELIDRGFPCLVTNFSRLTNTISGMWEGKQAYIDGLNDFSLLVIDDLASERDTEYMGEIVQNIIDARYRSGQPLIVTTNLTAEELKHPVEIRKQRIYSRLLEMCVPIEVTGTDRRKEKLKNDYDSFKKILEI